MVRHTAIIDWILIVNPCSAYVPTGPAAKLRPLGCSLGLSRQDRVSSFRAPGDEGRRKIANPERLIGAPRCGWKWKGRTATHVNQISLFGVFVQFASSEHSPETGRISRDSPGSADQ
jgi:hypothetical protein